MLPRSTVRLFGISFRYRCPLARSVNIRSCHSGSTVSLPSTIRALLDGTTSKDTNQLPRTVEVQGWVKYLRRVGRKMAFVRLVDGTTAEELQVVISNKEMVKNLQLGAAVQFSGQLVASPKEKQPVELLAEQLTVCGVPSGDEIIETIGAKASTSPVYLRHQLHLRSKHASVQSTLRCRHNLYAGMHRYMKIINFGMSITNFQEHDFLHVDTPVLTSSDCEGGGEVFTVSPSNRELLASTVHQADGTDSESEDGSNRHYFSRPAYLTVSGQLHLEAITALVGHVLRAYTFNSAFRAERNVTKQHLAEFRMLEAEWAFERSLDNLMNFVESLIRNTITDMIKMCGNDLAVLKEAALRSQANRSSEEEAHLMFHDPYEGINSFIVPDPYVRLTYDQALEILKAADEAFVHDPSSASGFMKEHEWYLLRRHGNRPLFLTHFPAAHKPFYMKINGDKAECFDLLAPIAGEIVGGSLREDDADLLEEKLKCNDIQNLQWYVDLRRSGYAPTGGFGLGFERFLQSALNIRNAKDTLPFPRWYGSCEM